MKASDHRLFLINKLISFILVLSLSGHGFSFPNYQVDEKVKGSAGHNNYQFTKKDFLNLFEGAQYKNISVNDGLSQGLVLSTIQDNQGFMWFGTKDGLNKFDGYNFTIYRYDPNHSSSISNNYISVIFEDSKNKLWIGTNDGLNLYLPETDSFLRIKTVQDSSSSQNMGAIRSVSEDNHGAIWAGTIDGDLLKIVISEKTNRLPDVTHFYLSSFYPHDLENENGFVQPKRIMGYSTINKSIHSIVWDKNNQLWLSIGDINVNTLFFKSGLDSNAMKNVPDPVLLIKNAIAQKDLHGNIWLVEQEQLTLYNSRSKSFTPFPFPRGYTKKNKSNRCFFTNIPWSFKQTLNLPDSAKFIWNFCDDGFLIFETTTQNYFFVKYPSETEKKISGVISSFFMDRSGVVWLGSGGYGVFMCNLNFHRFYYPDYHLKQPIGNIKSSIREHSLLWIYRDRFDPNTVWFSSYSILFKANRESKLFEPFLFNNKTIEGGPIYQDRLNQLWIGSVDALIKIDLNSKTLDRYQTDHKGIFTIFEGLNGNLWITQFPNILARFNPSVKRFDYFPLENNNKSIIPVSADASSCITQTKDGLLWIGTTNGLYCFDPVLKKIVNHFVNNPKDQHSINSNNTYSITTDPTNPDKYLWLGTAGGGLNRLNISINFFDHFTDDQGLPNNTVYGVIADQSGNLWLSTNKGLAKFNIEKERFHTYTTDDGLQGNEYNRFAHYKAVDGEIFFGGVAGLNYFYPDKIVESPHKPQMVITKFSYFDPVQSKKSNGWTNIHLAPDQQAINLPYDANTITIEYAALDYNDPGKNLYAYKLEGINKDWIYDGINRKANFSYLPPGDYVFQVKGTNSDGIWNETPAVLNIFITPPWWRTWWAYAFYTLLIAGLVYALRRYELNRLYLKNQSKLDKAKLKEREEVDRLKSAFFSNISHEFRTPLTLIIGPLNRLLVEKQLQNDWPGLKMMQRNARRLLRLVNQLLDFSQIESGKMKLKVCQGDIVSFVKGIQMSFQSLADNKNITSAFHANKPSIPLFFDRDKAEKIFSNILSNAFKFTPQGGKVEVAIVYAPQSPLDKGESISPPINKWRLGEVSITISNTGSFIPAEKLPYVFDRFYQADDSLVRDQEGTGIGLALTKELVELHHGQISVKSSRDKDTEFCIIFPQSSDHLKPEEIAEETENEEFTFDEVETEEIAVQPEIEKADTNKPMVLVVEDNPDMRAYILETLQGDYNIKEAFNGIEGGDVAREIVPDLIVSDLMMPQKDGYQLCSEIKQEPSTSHIPVILLTAKAERGDKLQGLETGADDYLVKPFDSQELQIRIRNLINQRQKLRDHFSNSIKVEPKDITVTSMDAAFLKKAMDLVESNFTNEEFNVEFLSNALNISSRRLHQKLKALTGFAPAEFILNMRLKRAADQLKQKAMTVTETAYSVGFNNLSYFARAFKAQFKCTPSRFK